MTTQFLTISGRCCLIRRRRELLISTQDSKPVIQALNDAGVSVVQIGEVLENVKPRIRVAL